MQPCSRRPAPRRSTSAFLALVWGALLLLAGAVTAGPVHGGAPSPVTVTVDRSAHHGGEARSPASRPDARRKTVAHGATATAPREVRPPGHPAHPPLVPAAASSAVVPLAGRIAAGPSQGRAPPRPFHDPRTSRGPPHSPLAV